MHSNHADIHEVGLQDDCEGCAAHAENPWSTLDYRMLSELISRNHYYRYTKDDRSYLEPRSHTEAVAMRNITNVLERIGKLMSNDAGGYIRSYLEDKWQIDFGN